jgi:hypothetical protein
MVDQQAGRVMGGPVQGVFKVNRLTAFNQQGEFVDFSYLIWVNGCLWGVFFEKAIEASFPSAPRVGDFCGGYAKEPPFKADLMGVGLFHGYQLSLSAAEVRVV